MKQGQKVYYLNPISGIRSEGTDTGNYGLYLFEIREAVFVERPLEYMTNTKLRQHII